MLYSYLKHKIPDIRTELAMGHSLGEYSALAVATPEYEASIGKFVQLVHQRGLYIRQTLEKAREEASIKEKPFSMTALVFAKSLTDEQIHDIVDFVSSNSIKYSLVCNVANINSDKQLVLSGWRDDVLQMVTLLQQHFQFRSIELQNVAAPFHCQILRPVEQRLKHIVPSICQRDKDDDDLLIPIVANINASVIKKRSKLLELLPAQVCQPVLWKKSIECAYDYIKMNSKGEEEDSKLVFIEISPRPTLSSFTKSILAGKSDIDTICISAPVDVDTIASEI
jgi:[acyl-carrier-protein] S-malonyltransferase